MRAKDITPGVDYAYAAYPRAWDRAHFISRARVVSVGPAEVTDRATVAWRTTKTVVLVTYTLPDSGRPDEEHTCRPENITGTWADHLAERTAADQAKAAREQRERDARDARKARLPGLYAALDTIGVDRASGRLEAALNTWAECGSLLGEHDGDVMDSLFAFADHVNAKEA